MKSGSDDKADSALPSVKRARLPPPPASSALQQLLGTSTTTAEFFATHWEQAPLIFHSSLQRNRPALPSWDNLLNVFHVADKSLHSSILHLKDQIPTTTYASPAAAYLDGASLIVNHAEAASSGVAALCHELRETFPHAFGNLYVTPPAGRAVDAHADDRDVFVLQLEGRKEWKVYGPPPVAFPAPDEQVGKHGLSVPAASVDPARALVDAALEVGDVMYIPRGFVHEAATSPDAPSLHLTLALPSHDWSWASLAGSAATAGRLPSHGRDGPALSRVLRAREHCHVDGEDEMPWMAWMWRRSVPPPLAMDIGSDACVAYGKRVLAAVGAELGPDAAPLLLALLRERSAVHASRQDEASREGARWREELAGVGVGPLSFVRRRRDDEPDSRSVRADDTDEGSGGGGGLMAREEFADALFATLARLTTTPCRVTTFDDGPLLDDFGKACFASVCVDLGLLVVESRKF